MLRLILDGGLFFTGPISVIGIALIILIIQIIRKNDTIDDRNKKIQWVNSLALFSLVYGILGQLIGLMGGLSAIQSAQGISPSMLAGGIYISSISTLFGLVTFLMAKLGLGVFHFLDR